MLESLHIRNLALVVELTIDFAEGLNTLTGETGAGKSLILGAVQLITGARVGPGVIRAGETQCEVSATFRLPPGYASLQKKIDRILEDAGQAPCEDGVLLLRRVVQASGSRVYANGAPTTLGLLRQLGALLVDVHGPHEHQSLLQSRCQLELLDAFAGLEEKVADCGGRYQRWQQAIELLENEKQGGISDDEAEFLRFQLQEIDAAELDPDEEEKLVEQYRRASNARRLLEIAGQSRNGLIDVEGCVLDRLAPFVRLFQELESLDPEKGAFFASRAEDICSGIQDLAAELDGYADSFELDSETLQYLEERLNLIQKLKRKYGPTVEDVLVAGDEMRAKIEEHSSRGDFLAGLATSIREKKKHYSTICAELAGERRLAAGKLAEAISEKLRRLGFLQGCFEIEVSEAKPGLTGADGVEFRFAPNPGEEVKALRRVASSGEMARVMLAVKTVLTSADNVPVLIFDEVDANIGGRIAVTVAEELRAIARRHQVLSITHLPQIAAVGQRHFQVAKHVENQRTITNVLLLRGADREEEIMRMLGADMDSTTALKHAREMLQVGEA